ncbi:MAG: threonine/serine exporter family protein, partial [Clostridia bacterium]|nr:threonine/serine exporter family protein [Clostridia bacterium]
MAAPKKKHNISDLFIKKGFMPYSAVEPADGEKPHDEHDEAYYEELLEFAVALANRLQSCGAETYRVEETITRIIEAYGVEKVDTFVIPSSIMASLETNDVVLTKIRRLKSGGTMLDGIERYSALCRRICIEKPDLITARKLLTETDRSVREYGPVIYYLAAFLIGFGFGFFFGGKFAEALAAGICGIATGASLKFMGRFRANA